jgi:hypothetical protein
MDWQSYARLRGFVPVAKPVVALDKVEFEFQDGGMHAIRVEGWCELHKGPGIPPHVDTQGWEELEPGR